MKSVQMEFLHTILIFKTIYMLFKTYQVRNSYLVNQTSKKVHSFVNFHRYFFYDKVKIKVLQQL